MEKEEGETIGKRRGRSQKRIGGEICKIFSSNLKIREVVIRIKVTDMTERMIPVDAYGFYTIVHGKPRPFQRLRRPVTVERGGAYMIRGHGHGSVYIRPFDM